MRGEPPAGTAGKAGITTGYQVVTDEAGGRLKHQIHQGSDALAVAIDQRRIHQRGQLLQRHRIGAGWFTTDKNLLLRQAAALIQTPHIPAVAQG